MSVLCLQLAVLAQSGQKTLQINEGSHFSNNVYFYWLNAKALLIIEYFKCVEFLI